MHFLKTLGEFNRKFTLNTVHFHINISDLVERDLIMLGELNISPKNRTHESPWLESELPG